MRVSDNTYSGGHLSEKGLSDSFGSGVLRSSYGPGALSNSLRRCRLLTRKGHYGVVPRQLVLARFGVSLVEAGEARVAPVRASSNSASASAPSATVRVPGLRLPQALLAPRGRRAPLQAQRRVRRVRGARLASGSLRGRGRSSDLVRGRRALPSLRPRPRRSLNPAPFRKHESADRAATSDKTAVVSRLP